MPTVLKSSSSVNQVLLHGFRRGLKQTSIPLRFELHLPAVLNDVAIDDDLLERFGLEPQAVQAQLKQPPDENAQRALRFAWQTMGLASQLQQAIRLPSFERGVLLEIEPLADDAPAVTRRYHITCQVAAVAFHSPEWISESFRWATRLLARLADPAGTETEMAALLEALHEQFVLPGKKQIPGGDSTIPVLKNAFLLDIPFAHLGRGIYQLGWGARRRLSDRSTSELDSSIGSRVSHHKALAAQLLRQAGLPAPVHQLVTSAEAAANAAQRIGFPVVIKPADKDRGEGVTVNVTTSDEVAAAFAYAAALSSNILVEKQVPGICYRILVVGDHSPYTVARLPNAVEGDGIHTVQELITEGNRIEARRAKHRRLKPLPADELAQQTLREQGLDFNTILAAGAQAKLRPIESTEWGGLHKVASDEIHPENLRVAIQAARLMNLHVAGVDLITEDVSRPWYENGAVINEVNFSPYLGLRYDYQRSGAARVVRSLFPQGARIPVEVFIGDEAAWQAALARLQQLAATGLRAALTSHERSATVAGERRLALRGGLSARCGALLMSPDVDALLLVVQTDELLLKGLPVDSVVAVTVVNARLASMTDAMTAAAADSAQKLVELCDTYRAAAACPVASETDDTNRA